MFSLSQSEFSFQITFHSIGYSRFEDHLRCSMPFVIRQSDPLSNSARTAESNKAQISSPNTTPNNKISMNESNLIDRQTLVSTWRWIGRRSQAPDASRRQSHGSTRATKSTAEMQEVILLFFFTVLKWLRFYHRRRRQRRCLGDEFKQVQGVVAIIKMENSNIVWSCNYNRLLIGEGTDRWWQFCLFITASQFRLMGGEFKDEINDTTRLLWCTVNRST